MDPETKRIIYIFPPGSDSWYRITVPVSESYAKALGKPDRDAWRSLLEVVGKLIARATEF